MLRDVVAVGADWVTGSAVRAQDGRVAVEALKVGTSTGPGLLVGTIENVVWLVGSVLDITTQKSSLEGLASWRSRVKAKSLVVNAASIGASSAKKSTGDHGTLRVTVEDDQCIRALSVVLGDLPDTVDGTFYDGRAELGAKSGVKDYVHVVTRVALSLKLLAGGVDEWRGTAIVVRSIVSASHEDCYIVTGSGELGRSGALCAGEGESGKDSSGEALLH